MKRFLLIGLLAAVALAQQQVQQVLISFGSGAASCGSPVSTNLRLWISADCITLTGAVCTFPADGTASGSGQNWSDRGPLANNLSADSLAHNCTFHTGMINGLPAMNFGGSCAYSGAQVDPASATTWAVFVVFVRTAGATKGDFTGGNAITNQFKYWVHNSFDQGVDKSFTALLGTGTAATDTNWHQLNVVFQNQSAGNTLVFRRDRAADGPSSFTSADVSTGITKIGIDRQSGYSEGLAGDLAELFIYSATSGLAISSGDRTTNETYLNCRYGL